MLILLRYRSLEKLKRHETFWESEKVGVKCVENLAERMCLPVRGALSVNNITDV